MTARLGSGHRHIHSGGQWICADRDVAEDKDPDKRGIIARNLTNSGSSFALAFLCTKALLPVRVPLTVAITPAIARCVYDKPLFEHAVPYLQTMPAHSSLMLSSAAVILRFESRKTLQQPASFQAHALAGACKTGCAHHWHCTELTAFDNAGSCSRLQRSE